MLRYVMLWNNSSTEMALVSSRYPETSTAPQDCVQPRPVSDRTEARQGWRTV